MEWMRAIRDTLWGTPMLLLLLACGLCMTLATRGVQFRRLGAALRLPLSGQKNQPDRPEELTGFQSLTAALAATVGTGNIAGVTAAVTLGGPGALAWMWAAAILGMATKYAEVLLAVRTRRKDPSGEWRGGPMYTMARYLGGAGKTLAAAFCLFGIPAAFGIGSGVQAGTIAETVRAAVRSISPGFSADGAVGWIVGILCAGTAAVTLLGGMKRLGKITARLVPGMAGLYILACLGVLILRREALFPALKSVFAGAVRPGAATGGAVGSILTAASAGARCGVFSNEAGMGSAPMAYAASGGSPDTQGLYGVFEVFADTLVLCTLTGLSLLVSGVAIPYGVSGTAALNALALGRVYGPIPGSLLLALCTCLFALGTILTWSCYGLRCWEYLFSGRGTGVYRCLYVLSCVTGALIKPELSWAFAETANGLMCVPNLAAQLALTRKTARISREEEKISPGAWKGILPSAIIGIRKQRRDQDAVYRRGSGHQRSEAAAHGGRRDPGEKREPGVSSAYAPARLERTGSGGLGAGDPAGDPAAAGRAGPGIGSGYRSRRPDARPGGPG